VPWVSLRTSGLANGSSSDSQWRDWGT